MDGASHISRLHSIVEVATALTEERDLDRLLLLIVEAASRVAEAERSSIFIYDRERNELWSRIAQGSQTIRFPADRGIAGAVVQNGEVINLADAYHDPRFNQDFDKASGFRTRSLITLPMRNAGGEIVGALQVLNRRDGAFTGEDEELLLALAGVAGAAVTNATLHEEIGRLFEGFASAAVVAIESRDPSTAGHSGRVAEMTCQLAVATERGASGRWAGVHFTRDQMQELRYAALLHDFGKVGVREHVLVKAEKLHPQDLALLEARFEAMRQALRAESAERRFRLLQEGGAGAADAVAEEERALLARLAELEESLEIVRVSNRPTVLPEGSFERLRVIAARTWRDSAGVDRPWLLPNEVELLSIRRGSLSEEERREIESHVVHTFNFLARIPWTRTLRRVPEIASLHHERLSGTGYPRRVAEPEIPVQARILTVSDIYDALTAADRPYKRAVPHEKALDILALEAKEGHLDPEILRVFVEAGIGARTAGGRGA